VTIGAQGAFTVEEARRVAADLYQAVRRGRDPVAEGRQVGGAPVERVIDEFMARHMEGKRRAPGYIKDTRRYFDKYVLPRWRGRDLREISRRDVIGLLDRIVDLGKPIAANRTLGSIRKMFNWALQRGIIEASPVTLVDMPGAERKKERTLAPDEIRAVWAAASTLGYPYSHFFHLALVLGQRREEIGRMRWGEVNEAEGVWTLARDRTKAGRGHVVPIPALAIEILGKVPRGSGEWVLTTRGDRPINGFGTAKERLDRRLSQEGWEDEPWTIHDLRRTVATGLGKLGTPRFVIGRILNHADRTVTGIYDRYEYLEEKRKALEEWGRYLEGLVRGPENVSI
jgi:integrase